MAYIGHHHSKGLTMKSRLHLTSLLGIASSLAIVLLLSVSSVPATAAGGAGTSTLYHGQKLKVGQCLRVTGYYNHKAAFCLDEYGVITLSHRGKICGTGGTTGNHTRTPGAYVTVTTKGDVVLYQYAGGRRLWHSGTDLFPGGHLVLSNTQGDQAALAIDTGQAFFTFAHCPGGTGLG
jgi:hypothetical protein